MAEVIEALRRNSYWDLTVVEVAQVVADSRMELKLKVGVWDVSEEKVGVWDVSEEGLMTFFQYDSIIY